MYVRLAGMGLTLPQGHGKQVALQALRSPPPDIQAMPLEQFDEPLTGAYHVLNRPFKDARDRLNTLLEETVVEALHEAQLESSALDDIPIFIGSSSYGIGIAEQMYRLDLENSAHTNTEALPLPLNGFSQISDFLRQRFAMKGPDFAYNTACTSSSNAILAARNALLYGGHRRALVIGIETFNLTTVAGFAGMQLLSQDAMRPFDVRRNGLVLGEGCAALLFEQSESSIGVTVSGGASQCDTFSISTSNPDGSSIEETILNALEDANISTDQVQAIKAHGTASPMNDIAEAAGMLRAFETPPECFCLKPYTGHTLGACGAIEFALTSIAIGSGQLPKSAGFEQYDDKLGITPLRESKTATDGYYLLNYFGFGGNNSSLVIHHQSAVDSGSSA